MQCCLPRYILSRILIKQVQHQAHQEGEGNSSKDFLKSPGINTVTKAD